MPECCGVCGGDVGAGECICPVCPVCGVQGNPDCYVSAAWKGHGLRETPEQDAQLEAAEKRWEEERMCKEDVYG